MERKIFCILLLIAAISSGALQGQELRKNSSLGQGELPRTDFAFRGALLDNFFLRIQAKVSFSFSESYRHFCLIWESAGKMGQDLFKKEMEKLEKQGRNTMKNSWEKVSDTLEDSFSEGKKALSSGVKKGVDKIDVDADDILEPLEKLGD